MSKLFSKVIIENIEKYNCNEEEAASLVDIYNSTVKKMELHSPAELFMS